MIRRRPRRLPPPAPAPRCWAPGCRNRRPADRPFCGDCWYRLTLAFRLAIGQAWAGRYYRDVHDLCRDAGRTLAGRGAARPGPGRRGTPAVAVCGRCSLEAIDPVIDGCTNPRCPFALEAAA